MSGFIHFLFTVSFHFSFIFIYSQLIFSSQPEQSFYTDSFYSYLKTLVETSTIMREVEF
jgi:hypothetical protein